MKTILVPCVLAISLLAFPTAAAEISLETRASDFAIDDSGKLEGVAPRFGGSVSVSDRISDRLDCLVFFDRDPATGNLLGGRARYSTSFMEISAGPSFGILNSDGGKDDAKNLFQPGLGIGMRIVIPGVIIATADTDFALPSASFSNGQTFIQRGELAASFYLPNVLCTARISQRNRSSSYYLGDAVWSVTDIGLYNEAFKKGSPFRISVDFVYRIQNYSSYSLADPVKVGNLILGTGATWSPNTNASFFAKINGALYSFTLNEKVSGLGDFRYDVSLGARFVTKSPKGID